MKVRLPRLDWAAIAASFTSVGQAMVKAAAAAEQVEASVRKAMQVSDYHREIRLAGLEQRMYVRAAMDPAYASPEALDALVQHLLTKPYSGCWVRRQDRARLAAAAMRGWADFRAPTDPPEVLAWHRHFGSTNVFITRGADGAPTMEVTAA